MFPDMALLESPPDTMAGLQLASGMTTTSHFLSEAQRRILAKSAAARMGTGWAQKVQVGTGSRGRDAERRSSERAYAVILKSRAARSDAPPEFTLRATLEFDESPTHPAMQLQTPPSATRSLSPEMKRSRLLFLARAARTRSMSPQKVESRLFEASTFGRVSQEEEIHNPRAHLISRARAARSNAPGGGPASCSDAVLEMLDEGRVDSYFNTIADGERSDSAAAAKRSVARPVQQIADDNDDGHSGPDANGAECRMFIRRTDVMQTRGDGDGPQCVLHFKSEREAAGEV